MEQVQDYSFIVVYTGVNMFAIRVYLAGLTLAFLGSMLMTNRLGLLAATVAVCSLLYLILDTREELQRSRLLEVQVSVFLSDNSASHLDS
jgi:hypothetical protein